MAGRDRGLDHVGVGPVGGAPQGRSDQFDTLLDGGGVPAGPVLVGQEHRAALVVKAGGAVHQEVAGQRLLERGVLRQLVGVLRLLPVDLGRRGKGDVGGHGALLSRWAPLGHSTTTRRLPSGSRKVNIGGTPCHRSSSSTSTPRASSSSRGDAASEVVRPIPVSTPVVEPWRAGTSATVVVDPWGRHLDPAPAELLGGDVQPLVQPQGANIDTPDLDIPLDAPLAC